MENEEEIIKLAMERMERFEDWRKKGIERYREERRRESEEKLKIESISDDYMPDPYHLLEERYKKQAEKAKQHQAFKEECKEFEEKCIQISLSREEQTALGRKIDKLNLKITIAEVLFGFSCIYLLSSNHEAYAIWMALWRIGFHGARK